MLVFSFALPNFSRCLQSFVVGNQFCHNLLHTLRGYSPGLCHYLLFIVITQLLTYLIYCQGLRCWHWYLLPT